MNSKFCLPLIKFILYTTFLCLSLVSCNFDNQYKLWILDSNLSQAISITGFKTTLGTAPPFFKGHYEIQNLNGLYFFENQQKATSLNFSLEVKEFSDPKQVSFILTTFAEAKTKKYEMTGILGGKGNQFTLMSEKRNQTKLYTQNEQLLISGTLASNPSGIDSFQILWFYSTHYTLKTRIENRLKDPIIDYFFFDSKNQRILKSS